MIGKKCRPRLGNYDDNESSHLDLLSTPMGIDNVIIGFVMEVQPLVTHNAA